MQWRSHTWHDCGTSTSKVLLSADFHIPPDIFTADLQIFILSGCIQIDSFKRCITLLGYRFSSTDNKRFIDAYIWALFHFFLY
ncbi:MAG: DUF4437 domain-containing protein [Cyanobacteria bacterium J06635_10]